MSDMWGGTSAPASGPGAERSKVVPSLAAGLVAALVGAILWAVIAKITTYELGFVALGIGLIVGAAMAAAGANRAWLPIAGGALAVLGCLLGKFFLLDYAVSDASETSLTGAFSLMLKNPDLTWADYRELFGVMDILFVALAGYEGWQFTRLGVQRAEARSVVAATQAQASPAGAAGNIGTSDTAYYPQGSAQPGYGRSYGQGFEQGSERGHGDPR